MVDGENTVASLHLSMYLSRNHTLEPGEAVVDMDTINILLVTNVQDMKGTEGQMHSSLGIKAIPAPAHLRAHYLTTM